MEEPLLVTPELPSAPRARSAASRDGNMSMSEAVQRRLDENPQAMRQRRETVEHPFGAIKPHGCGSLPHEDAAEGRQRDGAQRARPTI